MYEVELKVRAEHAPVRSRLDELGAERVGTVTQTDTYYDAPHRSFAETDEALRVRRETDDEDTGEEDTDVAVTYKGPLVDPESKTREEFETCVGDGEAAGRILDALGFEPAATVEKKRERYEHGGYLVSLDSVDGLGEFAEVETEASESEVESARNGASDLLRDLRLDPEAQIRTSYLGLLLDGDN